MDGHDVDAAGGGVDAAHGQWPDADAVCCSAKAWATSAVRGSAARCARVIRGIESGGVRSRGHQAFTSSTMGCVRAASIAGRAVTSARASAQASSPWAMANGSWHVSCTVTCGAGKEAVSCVTCSAAICTVPYCRQPSGTTTLGDPHAVLSECRRHPAVAIAGPIDHQQSRIVLQPPTLMGEHRGGQPP
jgi:hypothetical protein